MKVNESTGRFNYVISRNKKTKIAETKGWEEALQEARDNGDLITLEQFKESLK